MKRIFVSPRRYLQGRGELRNVSSFVGTLGTSAFVLISKNGLKRSGSVLEEGFAERNMPFAFHEFGGEVSQQEIDRLLKAFKEGSFDVVVGVGGGKVLDTAKAVAFYGSTPVVLCPTNAASDAPTSAHSILYTPEGVFDKILHYPRNPDVVLVDTAVIAASPIRLTIAGMGDALATYFEANSIISSNHNNYVGGAATLAAFEIAKLSYEVLCTHGPSALAALRVGAITPAVENIIETNTLLSGLGFENCGVATAHAIHNGLTELEETKGRYHGEKVAFGVLCLLVLEDYPSAERDEVYHFCRSVGLPVTLAELGLDNPSRARLMKAAERACSEGQPKIKPAATVTPEDVVDAMLTADELGKRQENWFSCQLGQEDTESTSRVRRS